MEWLQKYLGGGTGTLLAGLGGAAAQNQIIKDIEGMGATDLRTVYGDRPPEAASGGLMGEIGRQSTFKPFGVTTPTGARATFSSTGNLDTMLSPTEQALQEQLDDLGIVTSGDDNKLTLEDSDLLDAALTDNLSSVKELFTDTTNGVATRLGTYLENTIGDDGTLISHQNTLTKQASDIDTQIADLEKIVQANREAMINSFVAMETAQSNLNTQLNFLKSQLGTTSTS